MISMMCTHFYRCPENARQFTAMKYLKLNFFLNYYHFGLSKFPIVRERKWFRVWISKIKPSTAIPNKLIRFLPLLHLPLASPGISWGVAINPIKFWLFIYLGFFSHMSSILSISQKLTFTPQFHAIFSLQFCAPSLNVLVLCICSCFCFQPFPTFFSFILHVSNELRIF